MSETRGSTGETIRLARFCAGFDPNDLDAEVTTASKRAIVDTLASCYIGTGTTPGTTVREYAASIGGEGATIVGASESTLPHFAALANGTAAHALDVDDGHRAASAHPGSAVIPAALATAETNGATGRELLTAIALGYEAMITTAVSVQTSHRERHFHATATCGCFGAAVAAGSLLGLNERETAHAIGLAGTQAGGLFEFMTKGSDVKRFHPGRAALAGVLAAELAQSGFDGPDTIIEGPEGFAAAFSDTDDLSPFESLGAPFEITRAYIKPYPCCRHIHGPIDAALRFRDGGRSPEAIERIEVETYRSAAHHDKTEIETLLDAQMSLPYGFAVALLTGEAGFAQFDPSRSTDERIRSLMERTTVIETGEMERRYPETRPARVRIETVDGDEHTEYVEYPLGAPENPITSADLRAKFDDLSSGVLAEEERDAVFETVMNLESVESCRSLTELL